MNPQAAAKAVLTAAREWARAREKALRLTDSKSAKPAQVSAAKQKLSAASDRLADAVRKLETALLIPGAQNKKPVNWDGVFGAVAAVAKALDTSVSRPRTPVDVIDTTGEAL